MIEIKCTESEREHLLNIFLEGHCPLKNAISICKGNPCEGCLDENIDWDITEAYEKKKYKVNVEELLSRIVEVEADSDKEAEEKVREMYMNEEIVLDAEDLQSVEYFVQ